MYSSEFAKRIRKMVKSGYSSQQIQKELFLSHEQIVNLVYENYGHVVANSIMKRLSSTDSATFKPSILVLDTCAFVSIGCMKVINSYDKVILLTDVIQEMDRHKNEDTVSGHNIRTVLRESALDSSSQKYIIKPIESQKRTTDEKLIEFCKGKPVVLYTADYALMNLAKANNIIYLPAYYPSDMFIKNLYSHLIKISYSIEQVQTLPKSMLFDDKILYFIPFQGSSSIYHNKSFVLSSYGIKQPFRPYIKLSTKDIVLIKRKYTISVYSVTNIYSRQDNAKILGSFNVKQKTNTLKLPTFLIQEFLRLMK